MNPSDITLHLPGLGLLRKIVACTLASLWLISASTPLSAKTVSAPKHSEEPPPVFTACTIGTGSMQQKAECTTIAVPLQYEEASGKTIELAIARIPARQHNKQRDAFTFISGGPGQSAIETYPTVAHAFRHIQRERDIILIDQRGTGKSAKLNCDEAPDSTTPTLDFDHQKQAQLAQDCLNALPYDPRFFSTSIAVKDLDLVRQRLGVSQWNLYGVSYGTRLALHYLRRYPDAVRTLILDAVLPPEISLGPDIGPAAQRALENIFARCVADSGCNEQFGDLRQPTADLLADIDLTPREIVYEDFTSGKLEALTFTRQHLALTLRLMSYSAQTASILPSMLHDAITNNNFAPLARQSTMQSQTLGSLLATGMHHAVICTEDAPFVSKESLKEAPAGYLGEAIIESSLASCEFWPPGDMDSDFKTPVASNAPALILSGEADPVTPPEYGHRVAKHLPSGRHVVNEGQGHMQAPFGCMPVILAQFVELANASRLNTDCLERLKPLPFFIDANGPRP